MITSPARVPTAPWCRPWRSAGVAGLLLAVAGPTLAAPSVVVTWNQAALEEVRRARFGPPVVARALAVAHTCMYDAWVPYDDRAIAAVVGLPRRPLAERSEANKAKAVSYAAHRCLSNLFPAGTARLDAVLRAQGHDPADRSRRQDTPQGIGNTAAAGVLADRRNDGANQFGNLAPGNYTDPTGFVPANRPMPFCLPTTPGVCANNVADPTRWQPLINDLGVLQTFIAPHWGGVRPFALRAGNQFDSRPDLLPPPNYLRSAAAFNADMQQMLQLSGALTPQQKLIVEYWADGPASELPPGHWSLLAQHVARRDNHGIDADVKMFFALQNASFDAGIVGWHVKRRFEGVRPITAIRYFYQGQPVFAWGGPGQPNQVIDGGKWTPYNPGSNLSPAFPGYVSGHSIFSASSATVLQAFTGSDALGYSELILPNFGRVEPGVPAVPTTMSYPTFTSAVDDAGMSRLYAGIHFSDDNTVGQALGRQIGQIAWDKALNLFDGGLGQTSASQASGNGVQQLSWQHTVAPNSGRLLLVGVATAGAGSTVTSVSLGGVPLRRLAAQDGSQQANRVELWFLVAPAMGTGTVTVTLGGPARVAAGAMGFAGVNQAVPFGVLRAAQGGGTAACVTLANEPTPLVASVLAVQAGGGPVLPGSDQATAWQAGGRAAGQEVLGTGMVGAGRPVGPHCQALASAAPWGLLAVPLKAAY